MRLRGLGFASLLTLAACAPHAPRFDPPGQYDGDRNSPTYAGGAYGAQGVGGRGAEHLDPWLSGTEPGQRLVLAYFDHNENGKIGRDRAEEANAWFRRYADRNGDMKITDGEINRGLIALDRALTRAGF